MKAPIVCLLALVACGSGPITTESEPTADSGASIVLPTPHEPYPVSFPQSDGGPVGNLCCVLQDSGSVAWVHQPVFACYADHPWACGNNTNNKCSSGDCQVGYQCGIPHGNLWLFQGVVVECLND